MKVTGSQQIAKEEEKQFFGLKKSVENGEMSTATSNQNGLEKKKQEDIAKSSRLPEGFYKPIKIEKYLEFNREEIYSEILYSEDKKDFQHNLEIENK